MIVLATHHIFLIRQPALHYTLQPSGDTVLSVHRPLSFMFWGYGFISLSPSVQGGLGIRFYQSIALCPLCLGIRRLQSSLGSPDRADVTHLAIQYRLRCPRLGNLDSISCLSLLFTQRSARYFGSFIIFVTLLINSFSRSALHVSTSLFLSTIMWVIISRSYL